MSSDKIARTLFFLFIVQTYFVPEVGYISYIL